MGTILPAQSAARTVEGVRWFRVRALMWQAFSLGADPTYRVNGGQNIPLRRREAREFTVPTKVEFPAGVEVEVSNGVLAEPFPGPETETLDPRECVVHVGRDTTAAQMTSNRFDTSRFSGLVVFVSNGTGAPRQLSLRGWSEPDAAGGAATTVTVYSVAVPAATAQQFWIPHSNAYVAGQEGFPRACQLVFGAGGVVANPSIMQAWGRP